MSPRRQAVVMMRVSVGWSFAVCLVQLYFRRYGAAMAQVAVGFLTYATVKYVMWLVAEGERQALGPRLILRDDGRVCITVSVRPWHEPVITACGESARPREVSNQAVTCLACLSQ